jgi:cellulose synthase/poly-beta-1,6-N-acetylglucosamine synthase-like glycosyltransferase
VPIFSFSIGRLNLRPKFNYRRGVFVPSRKDLFVQRLLSVLLPVKDAQATLADSVHEILDVAADSGDRFELLIIDDGSTDATSEVAHELTRHYPQVRVVRHGTPLGREAAIRTGLQRSQGEAVLLGDKDHGFRVIQHAQHVSGRIPSRPAAPNYIRRLKSFVLSE